MSTPGAEDASRSPDYSGDGDHDESDMAEVKAESQQDGADPSKKSANAKDPLRPRRKKARRACMACQRAHLTCGDERPCERCIKRGLHEQCQDGVRKKAKYLHDAPDAALQPPVLGRSFSHMNGNHPQQQLPGQDLGPVPLAQQSGFYTQPPSATFYAQNPGQPPVQAASQEASPVGPYNNAQPAISPPYTQSNHNPMAGVPSSVSQGVPTQMHQFGNPMFDPSDPALFNFDISSLNFGNHYGALEMGMLGHMSSGAAETGGNDKHMMNNMNHGAGMYNQHVAFGENPTMASAIAYEQPNGIPSTDWQNAHSRHGSLQMNTPNNTPTIANLDHAAHRHDSLHHPHAFAIGQGPASFSSPSPASTEVNGAYDTDNTISGSAYFQNQGQHHVHQRSPHMHRLQQENRRPNNALQPIPSNVIRKRRRDTTWIYDNIKKPHDYVGAFHRMRAFVERRYRKATLEKIRLSMIKYRPALIAGSGTLNKEDLIHQEQSLQLSLIQIEESYSEVGVPSVVCRRSGEIVWLNKEFHILTGWKREVLLGLEPNMNVNTGSTRDAPSGTSTRSDTTPVIAGQPDSETTSTGANYPVLLIELLDERSTIEYFDDFAEAAFWSSRAVKRRRVNLLRYRTKEDVEQHERETQNGKNNGYKKDSLARLEGGPVHQEGAMSKLGKDGLVDCMIQWHVKRDNFEMPMLVCIHVMPVLDSQPMRSITNQ